MINQHTLLRFPILLFIIFQIGISSNLNAQNLLNNPNFEPSCAPEWITILFNGGNGTKTDMPGGATGGTNFIQGETFNPGSTLYYSDVQARNPGNDAGSPTFPGIAGLYTLSVWARDPSGANKTFRLRATVKEPGGTVLQYESSQIFTLSANWQFYTEQVFLNQCSGGCFADFNIMYGKFVGLYDFDDATFEFVVGSGFEATCGENMPASTVGGSDGIGEVTINGGVPSFTIDWTGPSSGSQTGNNGSNLITGLSAGTYNVTVTDNNGNTSTCDFTITEPTCNLTVSGIGTDPNCNGGMDGSITLNPVNGTAPYNYNWDTGSNSGSGTGTSIINLSAGTYNITLTDNVNCTATTSVTLNDPSLLTLSCSEQSPPSSVGGNDGVGEVDISGGTAGFTIDWSGSSSGSQGGNSGSNSINGLSAGTYNVTVTDANSCTETCSFTIVDPPCSLTASGSGTNPDCPGDFNGEIALTPTNGSAPYTYDWNNGGSNGNGSGTTINGLEAGTYNITLTDNVNCTATTSVTLIDPPALVLTCTEQSPTSTIGGNDGIGEVNISGGTAGFTIDWSGPSTGSNSGNSGSNSITGLSAGTYNVTVTDANNCSEICSFAITEPLCNMTLSATGTDPNCNGGSDGMITIAPFVGTPPYTYDWNNGANSGSGAGTSITNLEAGTYNITLTDNVNCTATTSVTLTDPPALVLTCSEQSPTSSVGGNEGIGSINISGGTAGFTINWVGPSSGSQAGNSGANSITNLSAGTYNVTVTDANNCTETCSFTINDPPCNMTVSATGTNPSCVGASDGEINLSPQNGTSPYTYDWESGSGGTGTGSGTSLILLSADNYDLTLTDNIGCTATTSVTLVDPPAIILACFEENTTSSPGASDGVGNVTITGGIPNFTISWSGSSSGSQVGISGPNLINGLSAGVYNVTVTDDNSCTEICNFVITDPPCVMTVSGIGTNPSCNGANDGEIQLIPQNGTPPYNYNWQASGGGTGVGSGTLIILLNADFYNVTLTDDLGCTATTSVQLNDPPAIILSCFEESSTSAPGASDGIGNVTITGGTPTFDIQWDNGTNSGNQSGSMGSNSINGLEAGTYSVTLTDNNNCKEFCSFTITDPPCNMTISAVGNPIDCSGNTTGSIELFPQNGASPYTFGWQNSSGGTGMGSGTLIQNLEAETYDITLTDVWGCMATETVTLTEPDPIILICGENAPTSSTGGNDGIGEVNISGGTVDYTIDWSGHSLGNQVGFSGSNLINGLSAGTYSVTITDANNCQEFCSFTINDPPCGMTISIDSNSEFCSDGSSGSIALIQSGGTAPFTFEWDNGSNSDSGTGLMINDLSPAVYSISITDTEDCTAIISTEIFANPTIDDIDIQNTNCGETNNGRLTVFATGNGDLEYSLEGNTWQIDNEFTGLLAGSYDVFVRDENSCMTSQSVTIGNDGSPNFDDLIQTNEICGQMNGSIEVTASGGLGTIQYSLDGVNYQSSGLFENLSTGPYDLFAKDENDCVIMQSGSVGGIDGTQIDSLKITDETCENGNGSIEIFASGGTGDFQYSIDGMTFQDTALFENLSADTFTIYVIDENDCETTLDTSIINIEAPILNIDNTENPVCNTPSGVIIISGSGGYGNLEYSIDGMNYQISGLFENLLAGTYILIVKDENDCSDTTDVTLIDLGAPSIDNISVENANCGNPTGSLTITASGGIGDLEYSIDGINFQSSNLFGSLTANIYTVTVQDSENCSISETVEVQDITAHSVDLGENITQCEGDGDIILDAQNAGATYLWSVNPNDGNDGATTQMITISDAPLTNTQYVVLVTLNSCEVSDTIEILINEIPNVDLGNDIVQCENEGQITLDAGNSNATYLWSVLPDDGNDGETFQMISITGNVVGTTNYSVEVNLNDCINSDDISLTINELPTIQNAELELCDNGNGTADFDLNDATSIISNGQTDLTISYFENIDDAQNNTNELISLYNSIETSLFARAENEEGCAEISELTLTILALPTFTENAKECNADLTAYEVSLNIDGDELTSNLGTIIDLGSGDFTISDIPSGIDLMINISNSTTDCDANFQISAPNCDCDIINAPIGNDVSICEGEVIPELSVLAVAGLQVNWYDVPTGGTLLLENSETYTPTNAGTYYAQSIEILSNCESTRTPVSLIINALPTYSENQKECAPDFDSYSVNISTNADLVNSSDGTITNLGGGEFEISNIPAGMNITMTTTNSMTNCSSEIDVISPDCSCPTVNAPTGNNIEICENESIPELSVLADLGLNVNWYDAPIGGTLLVQNSKTYTPTSAGTFYAEAIDPNNDCVSDRVSIGLIINDLPSVSENNKECNPDLTTWFAEISSDAEEVTVALGNLIDLGGGNYMISDIPIGMNVTVTLQNLTTDCSIELEIVAPMCDCPTINQPQIQVVCNDNNTPSDPNDDTFTYTIQTDISGNGTTYSVDGDDTQMNLNYGQIEGLFGPFPIAGGNLAIQILDDLTNGICTLDDVIIMPPQTCSDCIDTANAGDDGLISCANPEYTLNASASSDGEFNWQTPSGSILNNQNITISESGIYVLTVNFQNGCMATDEVEVLGNFIEPVADAGNDQMLDCAIGQVLLDGSQSQLGATISYEWKNDLGEILGTEITLPTSEIGTYTLTASNSENGCSSSDEVTVLNPENITASDDMFNAEIGSTINETIMDNDILGSYDNFQITLLNQPTLGNIEIADDGSFTYTAFNSGTDVFAYQICVTDCPEICSEATISIEIAEADELEISDAISPNGDGKNETWIIPNLDQYPENKLMIMNRWGQVLYKAKPYLSDWEGTNENGERLPEGVYYYLLTLDKDGRNARKGMITIIR